EMHATAGLARGVGDEGGGSAVEHAALNAATGDVVALDEFAQANEVALARVVDLRVGIDGAEGLDKSAGLSAEVALAQAAEVGLKRARQEGAHELPTLLRGGRNRQVIGGDKGGNKTVGHRESLRGG